MTVPDPEQGDVKVIREALGRIRVPRDDSTPFEKYKEALAALDRLAAALDKLKGENYALTHGRNAEAWNELQAALERAERETRTLDLEVKSENTGFQQALRRAEKAELALGEMREALEEAGHNPGRFLANYRDRTALRGHRR